MKCCQPHQKPLHLSHPNHKSLHPRGPDFYGNHFPAFLDSFINQMYIPGCSESCQLKKDSLIYLLSLLKSTGFLSFLFFPPYKWSAEELGHLTFRISHNLDFSDYTLMVQLVWRRSWQLDPESLIRLRCHLSDHDYWHWSLLSLRSTWKWWLSFCKVNSCFCSMPRID